MIQNLWKDSNPLQINQLIIFVIVIIIVSAILCAGQISLQVFNLVPKITRFL